MSSSFKVSLLLLVPLCVFCSGTFGSNAALSDTPPFISAVGDIVLNEDTASSSIPLLYGDAETPFSELRVFALSSNRELLPDQHVLFNDADRMVIVPATDQHGTATVTVTVQDAQGRQASQSFQVTVLPVNDPPEIKAAGPFTLLEDDRSQAFPFQVFDPDSELLQVTAISLNSALMPNANVEIDGSGDDRLLVVRPLPDRHGVASIIIAARDPEGAETRQEVSVRVLPVNDPPQFRRLPDQKLSANQSFGPVPLEISDDETPTRSLVIEGFSSNPALVPAANILFGGSGDARTMSIQPARDATGSALITIKAYDQQRLEASMSFLLHVERENRPPEIQRISDLATDLDKPIGPIAFTVVDPDDNSDLVIVDAVSLNNDIVGRSGIQLGGGGAERSLTMTPVSGASGVAEIVVTATDRHGGESKATFYLTVRPAPILPIAHSATLAVVEDTASEVLLTGTAASGKPLTFAIMTPPQKGRLVGEPPQLTYVPNQNAHGPDAFQFTVSDGTIVSLPASVSISIQEVNDSPTISPIADRRSEPGKIAGPIRFAVSDVETPAGGLVVSGRSSNPLLVPDQSIYIAGQDEIRDATIVPAVDQTGTATITLTVRDASGAFAVTVFELRVEQASGAPVGESQSMVTPEDVPIAIALRARDASGQPINYAIVDAPIKGVLTGVPPNLVYRPHANEHGEDRFTFKVSNASGESPATSVTVFILPINDTPLARSQSYSSDEDARLEIELSAVDADNDALTLELASLPIKGRVIGTPPRVTYVPDPDANGVDQFTFTASDGESVSAAATVRITVEPVNDPPVASPQFASGLEDTPFAVTFKASDPDGDPILYSVAALPAKGLLAGTPPDLVYIPNPNTHGVDRFTYKVSDGKLSSDLAVVTLMVVPVNDTPVAESQFLSLLEDGTVEILLGGRDPDNDPIAFLIATPPTKGVLSGTAPRLIYTPESNFHGFDSFSFKVNDGTVESLAATITISVRPVNDAPIAYDQFVTVAEDASHGLVLTGSDPDGSPLTFYILDGPKNGSVSGIPPNVTYTPSADFHGTDRFTFRVTDGQLESVPASVTIAIRPINDPPRAENQFLTATRGQSRVITLNGADAERDSLQFILASLPVKGLISGRPPDLVYHPDPSETGLDSFTYKVSDGLLESLPATVQIALTERANGPTISRIEDQISRNGAPIPKLPFTVGDVETAADKLLIAVNSSAQDLVSNSGIVVEGTGSKRFVQVTPTPGASGTATVTLVVWDEDGLAASVQFDVTIVHENSPPTAKSGRVTTSEDVPVRVDLVGADPDNDALSYIVTSPPRIGRLSGEPPSVTYTPNPNANGQDQFAFKVRDSVAESAEATVIIDVEPVNDAPTISALANLVVEPGSTFGPVEFDVRDADGDSLFVNVDFSAPELVLRESVVVAGQGEQRSLVGRVAASQSGVTTVTLTASDGELSARTLFELTILATNEPPSVRLTSPENATLFDLGDSVVLEADVVDPDGVARVEFYADGVLLGTAASAPYQWTWNAPDEGLHRVSAKAIDRRSAQSMSAPVRILVDHMKGRAAIFGDPADADLVRMRELLFELSVQSRFFSSEELSLDMTDYDLVIWHHSASPRLEPRDIDRIEELVSNEVPFYFIGDGLLSAAGHLPLNEQKRWHELIHLKPGGNGWRSFVEIDDSTAHPAVAGGGRSVTGFEYPMTPQQAAVSIGKSGTAVLARSGSYDLIVASAIEEWTTRFITQHLRLDSPTGAGRVEQAKIFQNAVWWLINKQYVMDLSVSLPAVSEPVIAGKQFEYRILVRHSGESSANRVVVTDSLPAEIAIKGVNLAPERWRFENGTATFELGHFASAQEKEIIVTAVASDAGTFTHAVELGMLGQDVASANNTSIAGIVVGGRPPRVGIERQGESVRLMIPEDAEYTIEISEDLIHWTRLKSSNGPATADDVIRILPNTTRFFRILRDGIDSPETN